MNLLRSILSVLFVLTISSYNHNKPNKPGLEVVIKEDTNQFSQSQIKVANEIIINAEKKVRGLLPNLPKDIKVIIEIVDWDLNAVGGVTGRTETNNPAIVAIQVSNKFKGDISNALDIGLESTIFHEFHHLSRGWAIQDNKFERGISIAMVNEGLAVIFAEEYTNAVFEENHVPKDADADAWVKEILGLSKYADYQKWMFKHPDGRTSIGYRSGTFLVRQAMAKSGKNILELSNLTPNEIIKLAGY
ncbi:hypothetical protein JXE04_02755 [Patescibacteria group bacterium]|nr:hypothetical protein [Patescibacteria group bacterium]